MSHVNCWLLALAFGLGLLLTLAFMIRRVKREVPVYGVTGRSGGGAKVSTAKPAAAAVAAVAGGGAAGAKLVGSAGEEPYGAGSFRLAGGSSAPSGWTIKGNEDSMVYHTTDSPSYEQTIAEVWFADEPTAQAAGFTHWNEGRQGASGIATFAETEPEIPPGPHGAGSATPETDGSGPAGWTVKGNEDSMLYHSPDSPSYKRTIAEVWFRDVETAEAAGFSRWDSGKSQRGLE